MDWRNGSSSNREDVPPTPDSILSTNDIPSLPSVDISHASSPPEKSFWVKKRGTLALHTMTFEYKNHGNIFHDVCEKVKALDVEKDVIMEYAQRCGGSAPVTVTIAHDKFLAKSLKIFYTTCEEWSTVIVTVPEKACSRKLHPNEVLYNTVVGPNFTVDERFYELLFEQKELCSKFLEKRKYICLLLGQDCLNWVNPAIFLCHLNGCNKAVKLGSFLNHSRIIGHYKYHATKDNSQCAKTILRRHDLLIESNTVEGGQKKKQDAWVKVLDLNAELESLDTKMHHGNALKADVTNTFFVRDESGSFAGKHLLVNIKVLEKMVLGDENALSSASICKAKEPRAQSYYSQLAARSKNTSKPQKRRTAAVSVLFSDPASASTSSLNVKKAKQVPKANKPPSSDTDHKSQKKKKPSGKERKQKQKSKNKKKESDSSDDQSEDDDKEDDDSSDGSSSSVSSSSESEKD